LLLLILATLAAGLFAGAAIYITLVEHPARMSCGAELALQEFRPSYTRAAVMQAALALVGCLAGAMAAWQLRDVATLIAAVLLGLVVPVRSVLSSTALVVFLLRLRAVSTA
jgi:hypothetical protein